MAGQSPGPLSRLLPAQDRARPDQQVAGVARVPQRQRLRVVGRVHVVFGQREPGQRSDRHSHRRRAQHPRQRHQHADRVADVPVQLETVPAYRFRAGQDAQRVAHAGDQQGRADMLEPAVVAEGHAQVSTLAGGPYFFPNAFGRSPLIFALLQI